MVNLEIQRTLFDNKFIPDDFSRTTTNLINLSKNPDHREKNISLFFSMINKKINAYLTGNSDAERYCIKLFILRTSAWFHHKNEQFPICEMLEVQVEDTYKNTTIDGPIGFNFSSYLRDYDFHVVLPKIINNEATAAEKEKFGLLHGLLYKLQFKKYNPSGLLKQPAIMALSVSVNRAYEKSQSIHPFLGNAYLEKGGDSITSGYISKMGLTPSFFRAPNAAAPLAFYHEKDDLENRSEIELYALISVMETLQQIYRPEIYCSNEKAGDVISPSLLNKNFTPPPILYDRNERDNLLIANQAKYVEQHFLQPFKNELEDLCNNFSTIYPEMVE
jgi:hypothetical protein